MLEKADELTVRCDGEDIERWEYALIDLNRLAVTCGLMAL